MGPERLSRSRAARRWACLWAGLFFMFAALAINVLEQITYGSFPAVNRGNRACWSRSNLGALVEVVRQCRNRAKNLSLRCGAPTYSPLESPRATW